MEGNELENKFKKFCKWLSDVNQSARIVVEWELTELERLVRQADEKAFEHGSAVIAGLVVYVFGRSVKVCARLSVRTALAPYAVTDAALKRPKPQCTLLRLTMDLFKMTWDMDTEADITSIRPYLLELGYRARKGDMAKFLVVWAECFVRL